VAVIFDDVIFVKQLFLSVWTLSQCSVCVEYVLIFPVVVAVVLVLLTEDTSRVSTTYILYNPLEAKAETRKNR
jgi:hypothetical protein